MRMVALQVQPDAGPGYLAAWAAERRIDLTVTDATAGVLPRADEFDAAVVLGSDASWAVGARPRWMIRLLDWMNNATLAEMPLLGICFGAQALATLHGGEVLRLPEPEVGWVTLEVVQDAGLAAGPWMCWHSDYILLPDTARELARTDSSLHAFAIGNCIGVQFHPEATPETITRWISEYGDRDIRGAAGSANELLDDTANNVESARARAYALFDALVSRVGTAGVA